MAERQSSDQSGDETVQDDEPTARFSPNDYGVEYEEVKEGDRVKLYSSTTEGIAKGTVISKKLEQSFTNDDVYYAEITVDIDPQYLHSGTVSAEEWAELPQIREVLA